MSSGDADLNTARVARAADVNRAVARRTLEDLEAIGVVEGRRAGPERDEYEDDRRACAWALSGSDGQLIADVLQAHREDRRWCHET